MKVDTVTGGTVSIDPQKTTYTQNEHVKLTASPSAGYSFSRWTGTTNSTENPLILKISSNNWLIPQFEKTVQFRLITDLAPVGGSVICSEGTKQIFSYGEKCSLKAAAQAGYQFAGWEGDIESDSDTIYITFDKDYQVYARFVKIPETVTYTLTVTATNGTVSCYPSKTTYYANETVRITAVPDAGYMFTKWNGTYAAKPEIFDIIMDGNKTISSDFIKREWSFIIYMAAENDLESAAIADLNELEAVNFSGKPVSVLVLMDRIPGYDATNGDWTDTRLFEVRTDPGGVTATIVSPRIDCPELGLLASAETELNMADPRVLSQLITFTKRKYRADNYGLIIWGHGTGWRSRSSIQPTQPEPLKAIAFDDTTGQYMTLPSFGSAIKGQSLSVIGFDTCFGALLEIAYEIRNDASWLIASEGVIPSNGWNYTELFNTFLSVQSPTASGFCDAAINQFRNQYSGVMGATISKIDLSKINSLKISFEAFSAELAKAITNSASRTFVLNNILNTIEKYHHSTYPSDLYIDLYSFADILISGRTQISSNSSHQSAIYTTGESLRSNINTAVSASWSQKDGTSRKKIGVHVIPLQAPSVPAVSHSPAYIRDSASMEKSSFVSNSTNWVPNMTPKGDSFLDKLFYWSF